LKTKSKLLFVGTSSGQTSLKRFHSSLLIKTTEVNLLIDCGDGIPKALIASGIEIDSIDAIVFSHLHPDHYSGFASFIVQVKQAKRKRKLRIFCHPNLTSTLKNFLINSFVLIERNGFEIEYSEIDYGEKVMIASNFSIMAKQNSHMNDYLPYLNEKKSGFASSSFLFMLGDKRVFYTADLGSNEDLNLFDQEKPNIIITETTHIEFQRIIDLAAKSSIEKIYLTHYSDELESSLKMKINKLSKESKEKIILAHDSLTLNI
jgi:ribonuclease BN (tRNA processing enzyme)